MRRIVLLLIAIGSLTCVSRGAAQEKPTVGVIGTGTLAGVLGPTLGLHGYTVIYGSRNPARESVRSRVERTGPTATAVTQDQAAAQADVILLAVPDEVVEEVAGSLGGLEGKVVIDVSGGEKRVASDGYLELVSDSTHAERMQSRLPDTRIVRINLPNVIVFVDSLLLAARPAVLIAGNDPGARESVARMMFDLGVDPWDAGPLRFSRVFDAFSVMSLIPLQQGRAEAYDLKMVPSAPLSCFVDAAELFGFGRPYDIETLPDFPRRDEAVPCEEWRRRAGVGEEG